MKIVRIIFVIIYIIFIACLLEGWARAYYFFDGKASFFAHPKDLVYMWYPELKNIDQYKEGDFNVLLLGGSALTDDWGEIPVYLKQKLSDISSENVNIINVAAAAHSSLDSLYKYEWLYKYKFDLVVFYHGINEVRANNVPKELWKDDYSHYSWYDELNFYMNNPGLRKKPFLFPYFFKHLLNQLDREVINRDKFVPTHSPRADWVKYGSDIKTKKVFSSNLKKIVEIAKDKKEPLVVMTFAHYKADKNKLSPDSPYISFTKVWGEEKNVTKGIEAHNDAIREMQNSGDFIFFDQEKAIGNNMDCFVDICHFSDKGSDVYTDNMLEVVRPIIKNAEKQKS